MRQSQALNPQDSRSHSHKTSRLRSLPRPAKPQDRRDSPAAERYLVILWKDQLDASSHWLKKAFYWLVYRPFIHFCRFTLKMPTFNAEECCGCKKRVLWLEFEQIVDEKWQAEQAIQTPNWGWYAVPTESPLPAETLIGFVAQDYPLADARTRARYQRNSHAMVEVSRSDLVQLAGKIAQTDSLVAQFHHSKIV